VAPHAYGVAAAAEAASLSSPTILAQIHLDAMRMFAAKIYLIEWVKST
jgi:hypothetical protein